MNPKPDREKILVVDDQPENIHILMESLEDEYEIVFATSGEKALEIAFSKDRPDLILLDLLMPGMDGYEVCVTLRAAIGTRDIPIIFITASGQQADEAKGLHLGAVDVIAKPFRMPIVEARIKTALRLKQEMDRRMTLARKLEDLNQHLEERIKDKTLELERTHENLKVSERKYRAIYENAIEGIFQTTIDGRLLSASPSLAHILGYDSPNELISSLTDLGRQIYVRSEDRAEFTRILERQDEISGFETQFRKKAGDIIDVMVSAKTIRDEKDNLLHFQGFCIDITDRREAEKEKARIEDQYHQAQKAVSGFQKLLRRTIREDIEIKTILSPDFHPVKADIGQIEQVMMNLAVNAADAMPEGGRLTIETASVHLDEEDATFHPEVKPDEHVMLTVSDTGCGMDDETLSHLFEPFFSTKGEQGTGLGLATVYGIVKQHGGNLWVYSKPGKGSTFKICLPVTADMRIEEKLGEKPLSELKGSETILLVEDSEHVRDLAHDILTRQGYRVLAAQYGAEALALMVSYGAPVHLLLTDVIMPEMNGKELFVRAAENQPGLKVLYMSGYAENVITHQGVLDEGVQFIQKPFTIHRLAAKVREILEQD